MSKKSLMVVLATALVSGAVFAEKSAAAALLTEPGEVSEVSLASQPRVLTTAQGTTQVTAEPAIAGASEESGAGSRVQSSPSGILMLATTEAGESNVPPVPPAPTGGPPAFEQAALEAKLEAARQKLQAAAAEVAALTTQMSGPYVERFMMEADLHRSIIGVQIDSASGKQGARVQEVSPGGPAAEAGVRAGDVIVSVNGTDVRGDEPARKVVKAMRDVKPDTKVTVQVLRDDKPRTFTITARQGPGFPVFPNGFPDVPNFTLKALPELKAPTIDRGALADMELATLTPRLGRYFGTEKGVLVVRAPANGALNLEDGDVILSIDGREPTSGSHATRILASYQPGEKIAIKIMRERKTVALQTSMPDRDAERSSSLHERPERPSRKVMILQKGAEAT